MRTFTLMLPSDPENLFSARPRYVIGMSTYIYTQLSMPRGGSPQLYWSPGVSFLMLDNWTQAQLDAFASFHAVDAVVSLQLTDEEASEIIALADSNTIRRTAAQPARR